MMKAQHTPELPFTPYAHATPKLPFSDGLCGEAHAQQEYVLCLSINLGFAAHGHHWHYAFANGHGRTLNTRTGKVTSFDSSGINWTDKARATIAKAEGK